MNPYARLLAIGVAPDVATRIVTERRSWPRDMTEDQRLDMVEDQMFAIVVDLRAQGRQLINRPERMAVAS